MSRKNTWLRLGQRMTADPRTAVPDRNGIPRPRKPKRRPLATRLGERTLRSLISFMKAYIKLHIAEMSPNQMARAVNKIEKWRAELKEVGQIQAALDRRKAGGEAPEPVAPVEKRPQITGSGFRRDKHGELFPI